MKRFFLLFHFIFLSFFIPSQMVMAQGSFEKVDTVMYEFKEHPVKMFLERLKFKKLFIDRKAFDQIFSEIPDKSKMLSALLKAGLLKAKGNSGMYSIYLKNNATSNPTLKLAKKKLSLYVYMKSLFDYFWHAPTFKNTPFVPKMILLGEAKNHSFFKCFGPQMRPASSSIESYSTFTPSGMGFACTSYVIGEKYKWVSLTETLARLKNIFEFFYSLPTEEIHKEFFASSYDIATKKHSLDSTFSVKETATFVMASLAVKQYLLSKRASLKNKDFLIETNLNRNRVLRQSGINRELANPNKETLYKEIADILEMIDTIYERINWTDALSEGGFLVKGWDLDRNFLSKKNAKGNVQVEILDMFDRSYSAYLLAMGSSTHPISDEGALNLSTFQKGSNRSLPLIDYLLPHAFVDMRPYRTRNADLRQRPVEDHFKKSQEACMANRLYTLELGYENPLDFPTYAEYWGLSDSFSSKNHFELLRPFQDDSKLGDRVSPTAAMASIIFMPDIAYDQFIKISDVENVALGNFGAPDIMKDFGLSASFNSPDIFMPDTDQLIKISDVENVALGNLGAPDIMTEFGLSSSFTLSEPPADKKSVMRAIVDIEKGCELLILENLLSGFVWQWTSMDKNISIGLKKAGFPVVLSSERSPKSFGNSIKIPVKPILKISNENMENTKISNITNFYSHDELELSIPNAHLFMSVDKYILEVSESPLFSNSSTFSVSKQNQMDGLPYLSENFVIKDLDLREFSSSSRLFIRLKGHSAIGSESIETLWGERQQINLISKDNKKPSRERKEPSKDNKEKSKDDNDSSKENKEESRDDKEKSKDYEESLKDDKKRSKDDKINRGDSASLIYIKHLHHRLLKSGASKAQVKRCKNFMRYIYYYETLLNYLKLNSNDDLSVKKYRMVIREGIANVADKSLRKRLMVPRVINILLTRRSKIVSLDLLRARFFRQLYKLEKMAQG
ncbi:hypothetical protein AB834_04555 [PVC group bacterium (ex Bugula neritina AB1)]|nr:hypothetical protein AB834_04555 [PVC group bacterium (ex Bugula neritina AB1)]